MENQRNSHTPNSTQSDEYSHLHINPSQIHTIPFQQDPQSSPQPLYHMPSVTNGANPTLNPSSSSILYPNPYPPVAYPPLYTQNHINLQPVQFPPIHQQKPVILATHPPSNLHFPPYEIPIPYSYPPMPSNPPSILHPGQHIPMQPLIGKTIPTEEGIPHRHFQMQPHLHPHPLHTTAPIPAPTTIPISATTTKTTTTSVSESADSMSKISTIPPNLQYLQNVNTLPPNPQHDLQSTNKIENTSITENKNKDSSLSLSLSLNPGELQKRSYSTNSLSTNTKKRKTKDTKNDTKNDMKNDTKNEMKNDNKDEIAKNISTQIPTSSSETQQSSQYETSSLSNDSANFSLDSTQSNLIFPFQVDDAQYDELQNLCDNNEDEAIYEYCIQMKIPIQNMSDVSLIREYFDMLPIGGDGKNGKARKQKLDRKAELARQSRKKKKDEHEALIQRVEELQDKNDELRSALKEKGTEYDNILQGKTVKTLLASNVNNKHKNYSIQELMSLTAKDPTLSPAEILEIMNQCIAKLSNVVKSPNTVKDVDGSTNNENRQ